MITVLDIETTFQGRWQSDSSDPTPYNPDNRLVSVGYKTTTGESDYLIFHHKDSRNVSQDSAKKLQDVLNRSTLVVGHNLKFDMSWLYESGFKYTGRLYDTMIFEYVNAKGLKTSLRLADILVKYNLPDKLDILHEYCGEKGLNVDEIPIDLLTQYGTMDVETTYALFQKQRELIKTDPLCQSMTPAMRLMNDFLPVLIDLERNGIKVDITALDSVEVDFKKQHAELEHRLKEILSRVMGHTPINLNSPEHISWVLHSVKVKDKKLWKEIFNLGTEERNGVTKKRYTKRLSPAAFRQVLKENCSIIKRTIAEQCPDCLGRGVVQRYCNDGRPRKNQNICHTCERSGLLYTPTSEVAGFRIAPISYEYAADGGFSTSKETLDLLLTKNISNEAKEFINLYKEYNAISSYLSTFVEGIRRNVRADNVLHTSFNQCITATGRLSSTRPNLQNQPRESTFPIRKVFISRFQDGMLLNADFKQLEFRVAAFLAGCRNAIKDIVDEIDVHKQTADAITAGGEPTSRQDAKKSTFRPLYGGTSGTDAQKAYFEYFFTRYDGIFSWHNKLCEEAVSKKYIQSPSGRVYAFPFCARTPQGSVRNATQIKNYPVQGFATGDILPITMIEMYRLMQEQKVKSVLVLTVHDSIVADVHPEEKDVMIKIFSEAFRRTIVALKERFNVDFNVPLDFDLEIGPNLLSKEKVKLLG